MDDFLPREVVLIQQSASEHSSEEWEAQKTVITRLYVVENLTLPKLMETMKNTYNFTAT